MKNKIWIHHIRGNLYADPMKEKKKKDYEMVQACIQRPEKSQEEELEPIRGPI